MPPSTRDTAVKKQTLSRFQPPLYVLIFGVLFGTTISMAKLGAGYGLPPISLVFWQMLGAGILLGITAMLKGQFLSLHPRHIRYYVIAGFLGNALPTTLAFMAAVEIGAALTGMVYPLSPIFTYAFALVLGMDKSNSRKIFGMLLGLAGAAVIVLPPIVANDLFNLEYVSPLWLGLAISIPVFLGFGNIYRSVDWPPNTGSLPLASGMLFATSLMLLPVILLRGDMYFPAIEISPATLIILGNILMSFVGFIFYFELQRIAGPVYFSQISYFITIATMAFGFLVFGERFEWYIIIGVCFTFAGLYLVSRSGK